MYYRTETIAVFAVAMFLIVATGFAFAAEEPLVDFESSKQTQGVADEPVVPEEQGSSDHSGLKELTEDELIQMAAAAHISVVKNRIRVTYKGRTIIHNADGPLSVVNVGGQEIDYKGRRQELEMWVQQNEALIGALEKTPVVGDTAIASINTMMSSYATQRTKTSEDLRAVFESDMSTEKAVSLQNFYTGQMRGLFQLETRAQNLVSRVQTTEEFRQHLVFQKEEEAREAREEADKASVEVREKQLEAEEKERRANKAEMHAQKEKEDRINDLQNELQRQREEMERMKDKEVTPPAPVPTPHVPTPTPHVPTPTPHVPPQPNPGMIWDSLLGTWVYPTPTPPAPSTPDDEEEKDDEEEEAAGVFLGLGYVEIALGALVLALIGFVLYSRFYRGGGGGGRPLGDSDEDSGSGPVEKQ